MSFIDWQLLNKSSKLETSRQKFASQFATLMPSVVMEQYRSNQGRAIKVVEALIQALD